MSLWQMFLDNRGRIAHKWKHYFPIYERHFARYVNTSVVFVEIGCGEGGSLQLWKRFFGPHATIVGVDIRAECASFAEDQIAIRIGDQSDPQLLQSLVDEFGAPDIVLDDGSHMMADIAATFQFLYGRLRRDGIYMVEDLHTAYWDEYGGGLRRKESFMERCKDLIDELNAEHTRGALGESDFSRSTLSMHFYDSVVVFERGRYGPKSAPMTGVPHEAI